MKFPSLFFNYFTFQFHAHYARFHQLLKRGSNQGIRYFKEDLRFGWVEMGYKLLADEGEGVLQRNEKMCYPSKTFY